MTKRISIDEREIQETLLRFGGPGGQNANKAAAAVQIRFDVARVCNSPYGNEPDFRKRTIVENCGELWRIVGWQLDYMRY